MRYSICKKQGGYKMGRKRRRGTAIVDTPDGILVVSTDNRTYYMPSGSARRGETRQNTLYPESLIYRATFRSGLWKIRNLKGWGSLGYS
jgi:hypothetical protein